MHASLTWACASDACELDVDIHMHICMYTHKYTHTYASLRSTYVSVCVCIHACTHINMHTRAVPRNGNHQNVSRCSSEDHARSGAKTKKGKT